MSGNVTGPLTLPRCCERHRLAFIYDIAFAFAEDIEATTEAKVTAGWGSPGISRASSRESLLLEVVEAVDAALGVLRAVV